MRSTHYNYRLKYKFSVTQGPGMLAIIFFSFSGQTDLFAKYNLLHVTSLPRHFTCLKLTSISSNRFKNNSNVTSSEMPSLTILAKAAPIFSLVTPYCIKLFYFPLSIWKYSVAIFTACLSQIACKLHKNKNSVILGYHCTLVPRTLPTWHEEDSQ